MTVFYSKVLLFPVMNTVMKYSPVSCNNNYSYQKNCVRMISSVSMLLSVDEISLELLKALDIVGLSGLRSPFSVEWRAGTASVEWQTSSPVIKVQH